MLLESFFLILNIFIDLKNISFINSRNILEEDFLFVFLEEMY